MAANRGVLERERAKWKRISGSSSFHQRREFRPHVDVGENPFCIERQLTDQVELRVKYTNPQLYTPLASSPTQQAREARKAKASYGQAHFGRRALNAKSGGSGSTGRAHWKKTSYEAKLARELAAQRALSVGSGTSTPATSGGSGGGTTGTVLVGGVSAALARSGGGGNSGLGSTQQFGSTMSPTSAMNAALASKRGAQQRFASFRDDLLRLDPSGTTAAREQRKARAGVAIARGGPRRKVTGAPQSSTLKSFGHRAAEASRHFDPFSQTLDRRHCGGLAPRAAEDAAPSLMTADSLAMLLGKRGGARRRGGGGGDGDTGTDWTGGSVTFGADTFGDAARQSLGGGSTGDGSSRRRRRSAAGRTALSASQRECSNK